MVALPVDDKECPGMVDLIETLHLERIDPDLEQKVRINARKLHTHTPFFDITVSLFILVELSSLGDPVPVDLFITDSDHVG